jgi:hypothetical protein
MDRRKKHAHMTRIADGPEKEKCAHDEGVPMDQKLMLNEGGI